jgi:hypothetical protein
MSSTDRTLASEFPSYRKTELMEHRRNILRHARSLPPCAERNHHRQVALLFRGLFKNEIWLDTHTVEGSGG